MKRLREIAALVWEILRELADERAYARHLERHGMAPSRAAWQAFSEERQRATYTRPKCC